MSEPSNIKDPAAAVVADATQGVSPVRATHETGRHWPPQVEPGDKRPGRLSATEGICQTMPELGALPDVQERMRNRRVVRLVSAAPGIELNIELQPGVSRIGRQRTDNHIVLVSPQISRNHCEIDVTDDAIVLTDLNSANGTFVNDKRISGRTTLNVGDVIRFSDQFTLRLLIDLAVVEPDSQTFAVGPAAAEQLPQVSTSEIAIPAQRQVPESLYQRSAESDVLPAGGLVESGADTNDKDVSVLERERRQLAVLYQVSKRCMSAESLVELDRLLINVLERTVTFDRGFITYQLPNGDWKLVMSPKGDRWERRIVRELLQTAIKSREAIVVTDSRQDPRLGLADRQQTDSRILVTLRSKSTPIGAIFLVSNKPQTITSQTADFLSLFSDIAALAIINCARLDQK